MCSSSTAAAAANGGGEPGRAERKQRAGRSLLPPDASASAPIVATTPSLRPTIAAKPLLELVEEGREARRLLERGETAHCAMWSATMPPAKSR